MEKRIFKDYKACIIGTVKPNSGDTQVGYKRTSQQSSADQSVVTNEGFLSINFFEKESRAAKAGSLISFFSVKLAFYCWEPCLSQVRAQHSTKFKALSWLEQTVILESTKKEKALLMTQEVNSKVHGELNTSEVWAGLALPALPFALVSNASA